MMKIIIVALLSMAICHTGRNWAVLVAGSEGYANYRHQADVFHAYQVLIRNGIPKENIILFAKDDIVHSLRNPFKGKVFNKPNGEDVYEGVVIDYSGKDVTPENYIKVITGDKEAMKGKGSGRVLESTQDDNIFMFFSDHGADGLICFPKNKNLYADTLVNAFTTMKKKQMYNKIVYYLEACYSGSMFEKLSPYIDVYATTAANSHQSSYAYYCGADAVVNGRKMGTCLGDEYSIKWLENADEHCDPTGYTIGEQFDFVKSNTIRSQVCEFGMFDIKKEIIGEFLFKNGGDRCPLNKPKKTNYVEREGVRLDSRQAQLNYLKDEAIRTGSEEDMEAFHYEVRMIARSKMIFDLFRKELNIPDIRTSKDIDYDCLRLSVEMYKDLCGIDDRDLEFIGALTTACSLNEKPSSLAIYNTLKSICKGL